MGSGPLNDARAYLAELAPASADKSLPAGADRIARIRALAGQEIPAVCLDWLRWWGGGHPPWLREGHVRLDADNLIETLEAIPPERRPPDGFIVGSGVSDLYYPEVTLVPAHASPAALCLSDDEEILGPLWRSLPGFLMQRMFWHFEAQRFGWCRSLANNDPDLIARLTPHFGWYGFDLRPFSDDWTFCAATASTTVMAHSAGRHGWIHLSARDEHHLANAYGPLSREFAVTVTQDRSPGAAETT